MSKFLTFCLVAVAALMANEALAQCANCASNAPVFNQGATYSAPVNYGTPSYGVQSYGTPVYETQMSWAPTSYAPSYNQPVYSAPMTYGTSAPCMNCSQPVYSQPMNCGTPACGGSSYPIYGGGMMVGQPIYSSGCNGCGMISNGAYMPGATISAENVSGGSINTGTVIESPAQGATDAATPAEEVTPPVPTPEPENETPTPSPEVESDSPAAPDTGDDT